MLAPDFSPFPLLQTKRLLLKEITLEDAPALFVLRSDRKVMENIDRPLANTVDDAMTLIKIIREMLAKNDGITWGIHLAEGSELVGTIGFWQIEKENYRAEIGYLLHPELQGKGLMHEALQPVLRYGFDVMKLHSVVANIKPGNKRSEKLLLRNGFVQEAYFRENYYHNGAFCDTAVFSLLAPATPQGTNHRSPESAT